MQHHSIPTCYFPSTALFIDDNRDFLLNFVLQLDESLAYKTFDSPFDALDFIQKKRCEFDMLNKSCLSEYTQAKNCPITNQTINVNLAAIHAEVYNPRRFSEISVIVIDYAMPGLDGIEFCRKIADTNIKKILLTGKADEKVAIDAFNEGLIHRYIQKNDPNAAELITKSIYELQWQYFQAMSEMIVRMLSVSSPICLYDKKFAAVFNQLRAEKGIVEFYLADNSGSFLLLDEDAKVSFLIVKNQSDLSLHHDFARDNGADEQVLNQLTKGQIIPCLWHIANGEPEWHELENCFVPAQTIEGDNTYFYAYVHGPVLFDVRQDKILSYHRHLDELDAEELLML